MTDSHKRERSPAVVITIAVAVLLTVYVLSIGPAHSISTDRYGRFRSENHRDVFCAVYWPIIVPYQRGPAVVRKSIRLYLGLFEKG